MFKCYLCCEKIADVKLRAKHLKFIHCLYDGPNLLLKCCFLNCKRSFRTYNGFKKHLYSHNSSCNKSSNVQTGILSSNADSVASCTLTSSYNDTPITSCIDTSSNATDDNNVEYKDTLNIDISIAFSQFYSQIHTIFLPQSHMQIIYKSVLELVDNIGTSITSNINDKYVLFLGFVAN